MERVHERLDQVETQVEQSRVTMGHRRERRPPRVENEEDFGENFDEEDQFPNIGRFGHGVGDRGFRYRNKEDRVCERVDNNLGSIKMKIPSFQGKNNP